jgi:pSer/pThr/pTyr-binding forkhead associated (FHA) protein
MTLAGRYELLECLGRGGMGSVWRAHDPMLDRTVAVKILDARDDLPPELRLQYVERFTREARAAARLVHPNIVGVFDMGVLEDRRPYLVMEHVAGHNLEAEVAAGPVEPRRVAELGRQLAGALQCAHAAGIVHRDVKPANALVGPDGAARLMDFGIARLSESTLTERGQYLGSPRYSSPEQIAGEVVDARSDVFSLGLTLYVLLTGSYPFPTGSMSDTVRAIVRDELAPPSFLLPGLSMEWDRVLQRALAKDRADRYPEVSVLGEALASLGRSSGRLLELVVVEGADAGRRALLDGVLEVGRGTGALSLTDSSTSARHCRIELSGGKVMVTDLGSANGTWLDGARIERAEWTTGQVLALGRRTHLRLVDGAAPPAPRTATEIDAGPVTRHVLVVKSGPAAGQRQPLDGPVRLGRDEGDLPIPDTRVSRRHALVEPAGPGRYALKDLSSANGTWIGEQRVEQAELRPGDSFRVGNTVLAIEEEPAG